jgi:predicted DCC family thiol-disulfide oxidoreductase YuxK
VNGNGGVLIYDGDCGFCTISANWIARRWPVKNSVEAVPWQFLNPHVTENLELTLEDFKKSAWWIEGDLREEGSRAVARSLIAAGGSWAILGRLLLVPPMSWIAPFGYRIVARFRYRLPGGTPACKV